MSYSLSEVQAMFAQFINRDGATDSFVATFLEPAQKMFYSKSFFLWTLKQGSIVTISDKHEYDLSDAAILSVQFRKLRYVFTKDSSNTTHGKFSGIGLYDARRISPDPESTYGVGEPLQYYPITDKIIGFVPVPDDAYTIYIDYYEYPLDPVVNGTSIPDENILTLLKLLSHYWYSSANDTESAIIAMRGFTTEIKEIIKDDLRATKDMQKSPGTFGERQNRFHGNRFSGPWPDFPG